jgi:hypothetical protein
MPNRLTPLIVRGMFGLLLTVVVLGGAYAQDSSTSDTKKNPPQSTNPADQSYSVSLTDGQAIPLSQGAGDQTSAARAQAGQAARTQLLYGGTASVVYMDSYAPASIQNSTSGVFSPYVGLYVPTKTGGMTLQYLGTFSPDGAFTGDFEAFHSLAFNAAGAFTHRLYWSFSSSAEYGSEAARFEGPLTYLLVDLVPVVDPVASGALFQGRNAAFVQNTAKLGWRKSQRDRIELSVFHTYTDLSASPLAGGLPGDRSNAIGTKLDYARDLTSRVTFHVYGDEEHVMESSCNTYGAGAGITARLSYSWYVDVSGGPQWTSANCGSQQNYSFYGALVKNLRKNARAYVVAWRTFNTAFQTTSTYQDAAAVGLLYPIRRFSVQGDAGYFRGDPVLVTDQPLQGYYVAPLVRYRLTEHTSLSAGYRVFHATGGNTVPGNLHYAMFSLEWHPGAVRLK